MSPSPKGAILVPRVKNFKCKYSHTVHIMDCPLCLKVSLKKCHLFLRQTTCNALTPHSSSIHGLLIYFKVLSSKKIRLVCIVQFTCERPKLGSHTYGLLIKLFSQESKANSPFSGHFQLVSKITIQAKLK